ncbi:MAG: Gfo/Idh/MocA family protein [Phycisphaerales bacterium]
MGKSLRIGIIGSGVIAPTHIESYQLLKDVEVVCACDLIADKAKQVAEKYKIAGTTTDYHQLLNDPTIDLVSVCTDHASHERIVVDAFKAGKHVVCEKSLAARSDQLDRMLAAHAAHPELLFSGIFQHRFDGVNRAVRRLIAGGKLGKMLTANMQIRCFRSDQYYSDGWHGTWAKEGGSVLINQAIHSVDSLAWIMGGISGISAAHANLNHESSIETEDTIAATVRFANGALGTMEATCASHIGWEITQEFHGTLGSIEVRDAQPRKVVFVDPVLQEEVKNILQTANDPRGVEAGRSYYGTGHPAQIADVVDALRSGRAPFVTGEQASHAVRIVLGAYESQRTGGWVEVPAAMEAEAAGVK